MFVGMVDGVATTKLPRAIEAISELRPSQNDSRLLPSWLAVMARGCEAYAQVPENETFVKLPDLFDSIAVFLASLSQDIRTAAAHCLISLITSYIPDSSLFDKTKSTEKIFKQTSKNVTNLLSVRYQGAWSQAFDILVALLDKLRWRSTPRGWWGISVQTAASRARKRLKKSSAMGPETVLSILPLNLITPAAGSPGRVWMLPILRDYVENANLAHFKQEFVPLSKALFQKVVDFGEGKGKAVEIKIFETLVNQIWSLLSGYCTLICRWILGENLIHPLLSCSKTFSTRSGPPFRYLQSPTAARGL
jgi:ribosomal RNA-processing protein 12